MKKKPINNIIVISDTHCGCQLALMPPKFQLDHGPVVSQSRLQKKIWNMWQHFWNEWVPQATKGQDYIIVHNGDAVDGVHHNSVTQITHNIKDQVNMARDVLLPVLSNPKCKGYYHIRGTEAHVGKSGQSEEGLASSLGAIPDENGNHARWEMYMRMNEKYLIHFTHHIGTTSSSSYESTQVYKELVEAYVEAGRWQHEPPDVIVRSHRHREFKIDVKTGKGNGISHVTAAWQLKTPFVFKLGMKQSTPQIGGSLITSSDDEGVYIRSKVWDIERPKTEIV
jgi:hypothetical protein